MKELLRFEHVHFRYEEKYPALTDVSVRLCQGERVAVLGNNGAGKSTFFLCCNGVLRPQHGKIFLKGREVTGNKKDISALRQTVGLVFQDPDAQIIAGTVESEVSFGPMNLGLAYDEVVLRVERSLKQMNLDGYQSRAPQYLSGGEKKRVSIADILAMHPDMILLDEPTASLDPENVSILENTLDDLSKAGITLVVSTHDVDFAFRFATRAVVFNRGQIVADANIDDVFASETVLRQAGLKKPLICSVSDMLESNFPQKPFPVRPRSVEDLEKYIMQFKRSVIT